MIHSPFLRLSLISRELFARLLLCYVSEDIDEGYLRGIDFSAWGNYAFSREPVRSSNSRRFVVATSSSISYLPRECVEEYIM